MEKDPVCGMKLKEEETEHKFHLANKTVYFCSSKCKEKYAQISGIKTPAKKKGVFARFLEKLAKKNEQTYGGTPPKCH